MCVCLRAAQRGVTKRQPSSNTKREATVPSWLPPRALCSVVVLLLLVSCFDSALSFNSLSKQRASTRPHSDLRSSWGQCLFVFIFVFLFFICFWCSDEPLFFPIQERRCSGGIKRKKYLPNWLPVVGCYFSLIAKAPCFSFFFFFFSRENKRRLCLRVHAGSI